MSVDLRNANGDEFTFSTVGWMFYLNLAAVGYGWEKAGTLQPKEWSAGQGEWPGAYDWNAGQTVAGSDALALAAALEQYLAAPSGKDKARTIAGEISEIIGFEIEVEANDDEFVCSFIQFAKLGGFEVW